MIEIATRHNQQIAVLGLGTSGLAAARALEASGAIVTSWDDSADRRNAAMDAGLAVKDPNGIDFSATDALVLAPGIPFTYEPHPIVEKAQKSGCPIIGDVELLIENCPDTPVIAITGTNGKSTTTSLIGHIFDHAGLPCQVGGNLGPPVLDFDPPGADETLILELSSYQLDLTDKAEFRIALFINASPDHLDRHGTMDAYIAAKKRIFRNSGQMKGSRVAIVGIDDQWGQEIHADLTERGGWRVIPVSVRSAPDDGIWVKDGILIDASNGRPADVTDLSGIATLRGCHNWQNAACAYIAALSSGIGRDTIAAAMQSYPGLPHRMEPVARIGQIEFVNDSKATNVEAANTALVCYDNIYWIAGGQAKEESLTPLLDHAPRIRHAYLIGDAADAFDAALSPTIETTKCGDLRTAIAAAWQAASQDASAGTILLSPACASFDQWKNFSERGDAFRTLAQDLMREAKE